MKKFLWICIFLYSTQGLASHIAGGGIELLHIDGNAYRINVIIFFDKVNGMEGAKDDDVTVSFFSKSNDTLISGVRLTLESESRVGYTVPECSKGEIITDRLIYTAVVTLDPDRFNEPQGYYAVWERCCRNYIISNIFSDNPDLPGGISAGQTFYLEFPPVVKQGRSFINSSPRLPAVLNDYACPGKWYYVDLTGTDDDGDSLAYSLVTPYSTHTIEALPPVRSGPYPLVTWVPGYSLANIMNGSPDLTINANGVLTVLPRFEGLFLFAIRVEEFRDGVLIGVNVRDYQILVVDRCGQSVAPEITGPTTVNLSNTDLNASRCITVRVSDADSMNPLDNFTENISIRAVGLDFFNNNLTEILPDERTATLIRGSTKDFSICLPICSPSGKSPYQIGIIAMDDACSLPLLDTLKITVYAEPPPNTDPYFTAPVPLTNPYPVTVNEGERITLEFAAKDNDREGSGYQKLTVSVDTDDFLLADAGMDVSWSSMPDQSIKGSLSWNTSCELYSFSERTSFRVAIKVNDADQCGVDNPAELVYNLNVILPGNAVPVIDTDLTPLLEERWVTGIQRKVYENLSFNVVGEDRIDNDFLVLDFLGSEALGVTGSETLQEKGIDFTRNEGRTTVRSRFNIDMQCDYIDPDSLPTMLDLQFMVRETQNKCKIYRSDTVTVEVELMPPDNIAPNIKVSNLNPDVTLTADNVLDIIPGQQIILGIDGLDSDTNPQDFIRLEIATKARDETLPGYAFQSSERKGSAYATFIWNPECSIFENGIFEKRYTLMFWAKDDRCFNAKADTIEVEVNVKDRELESFTLQPSNFFSPNGDGKNDFYSLQWRNTETGELENILPQDNCLSKFEFIRIYNRWGKQVFESADRNFKWGGGEIHAGVYYYTIIYSDKQYKGPLSIRY